MAGSAVGVGDRAEETIVDERLQRLL